MVISLAQLDHDLLHRLQLYVVVIVSSLQRVCFAAADEPVGQQRPEQTRLAQSSRWGTWAKRTYISVPPRNTLSTHTADSHRRKARSENLRLLTPPHR